MKATVGIFILFVLLLSVVLAKTTFFDDPNNAFILGSASSGATITSEGEGKLRPCQAGYIVQLGKCAVPTINKSINKTQAREKYTFLNKSKSDTTPPKEESREDSDEENISNPTIITIRQKKSGSSKPKMKLPLVQLFLLFLMLFIFFLVKRKIQKRLPPAISMLALLIR